MSTRNRRFSTTAAIAAAAALVLSACSSSSDDTAGTSAAAAGYPEKDINFIVQAAAGGGSDLSSRALAAELEKTLGVSIIVENRPGASGSTAMQYVKEQDPDGYTIGFAPVEIAMLGSMNFDVKPSDYDLLGQIMLGPGVISVPTDSPYQTLGDLVEAGKTTPITVANSGAGSIWELTTLGLAEIAETQLTPVPFDGGAPAVTAVMGGQVDAAVSGAGEAAQNAKDGALRILAVFHSERHPLLPDVPTANEEGFDMEFGGWGGIYAPKGLPADVSTKLASAIEAAANSQSFKDTIGKAGNLPVYKNPADFTAFATSEFDRFAALLSS